MNQCEFSSRAVHRSDLCDLLLNSRHSKHHIGRARARRKRGNNFYFLYSAIDLIFHFSVFCVAFVCNALKIISTPRVRHFVGHVTINLAIIHAVNAETRFAWVDGKALIVKKVWNLTKQFLILEMQSFAILQFMHKINDLKYFGFDLNFRFFPL